MRMRLGIGLVAAALLSACGIGASPSLPRDGVPVRFGVDEKQASFTTAQALAAFERAPPASYRIGPGDELTITVWGRPELSGSHVVGPDGYVTLPVAGPLSLGGLDRGQSLNQVSQAFGRYYETPIVTIGVDKYVSNRVLVLGRVTNPGAVHFVTPPTLLDAIALAGGLPVGGIGAEKAALTRCAVFRGRDRVVWLNLKDLLAGRDLNLNLALQSGDLVYIPDADDQLIYALGEVRNPGAYNLSPEMTLLDVIARAGGLTEDADPSQMTLVRPPAGGSMVIDLEDLLRPDPTLNVSLAQGDVLYVPTSGLGKIGYLMRQINPLTSFVVFSQGLAGGSD